VREVFILWSLQKKFGKSLVSYTQATRLYDTVGNLPLKRKRILTSEFGKLICSFECVTDHFVLLILETNHYGCAFGQS